MLIAVDIGNTNIVLGFIEDEQVAATYRITTKSNHTSDEFGIMMLQFLQLKGFAPRDVHDVIITSVVPKVMHSFTAAIVKFLGITPMVVGPDLHFGQLRRHRGERLRRGADAGRDQAAGDGGMLIHVVVGGGCAHVDHERAAAVRGVRAGAVGEAVGAE